MSHDVQFTLPKRTLGKADVRFEVKRDGKRFGTLAVSKGSLVWFPSYTTYGYKMGWEKFEKMMKEDATKFEKR